MSEQQRTCGQCQHWHKLPANPQDLRQVLGQCLESPPVPLAIVMAPGAVQISVAYPTLPPVFPACGRFKAVEVLTNGRVTT